MSKSIVAAVSLTLIFAGASFARNLPQPLESYKTGETVIAASPNAEHVFTMLISPFAQPNPQFRLLERTIDRMTEIFGEGNLEVRISTGEPEDFATGHMVICSAGTYLRMIGSNAQALATAVSSAMPDPNKAEGSVFIALKSRSDIQDIPDMAGKKVALTGPRAFTYSIALSELARQGYDPDSFFGEVFTTNYDMPWLLELLRHDTADIAIVRTCFLEELAARGEDISDIRPIGVRSTGHAAGCAASTELYPNWTFLATASLEPQHARQVAKALLSMPADEAGQQWSIASDFSAADSMYRSIRHGPYEYLRYWSLKHFWHEYWRWLAAIAAAIILLAAHTFRTRQLLDARTRELRTAISRQHDMEKRTIAAQTRMESLQKAGAVGQMSSIVAHELRQPLSTIVGYAHGMERMLDEGRMPDRALLEEGISTMREQAEAAEKIIRKVCSYAKGQGAKRERLNALEIVRRTAATMTAARITDIPLEVKADESAYAVCADPMELELAVQNLVKNAVQAVRGTAKPEITITLEHFSDELGIRRMAICVADNGPALTDEKFARLTQVLSSDKTDGLGLGLSIVALIAENHGGKLAFERRNPNGLIAKIILPDAELRGHNESLQDGMS